MTSFNKNDHNSKGYYPIFASNNLMDDSIFHLNLSVIRWSERLDALQLKYFHFRFDSALKLVLLHL
jgi:hypothetical protein